MYKFCIFAGTTEGRRLVEFLSAQNVLVTACVATDYGQTLLQPSERLTISAKRMTEAEMAALFAAERFDLVIDATHPYADLVTENISAACEATDTEYLRLLRDGAQDRSGCVYVADIAAAVDYLNATEGKILLTTGSKELSKFAALRDFSERVYARVLPMMASLEACAAVQLPPAHIIAMQGPFSEEMNTAQLRSVGAKYLVTKDGGSAGGFEEKIASAKKCGATPIVIGRPPQKEGVSLEEAVAMLKKRFAFSTEIAIVGIGMGSRECMTEAVWQAICKADCLIGAKRMLEAVAQPHQLLVDAIAPQAIADAIQNHPQCRSFAVVMSGDVGFFSGTKKLLPLLEGQQVKVLSGISSLVYFCAKLKTSYDDAVCVSLHGRTHDIAVDVRRNRKVFALVGGKSGIHDLCQRLLDANLNCKISVGQRLSYPDERIVIGTAQELLEQEFDSLSVALIENPAASQIVTHGLPDNAFLRRMDEAAVVPMTKSEVRSIALSKLALTNDAVCWDIGAGTGSVAIEMALQATQGQVFAIERKSEAVELLQDNKMRFGTENLTIVSGLAPEACLNLPAPTHVFIGGSSGNMHEILSLILVKNPKARIVATAIAMETVAELTACMKEFAQHEAICVNISTAKAIGSYHLMRGNNPIYIFTLQNKEETA